ncbi:MAG: hypothetical protein HY876_07730, partial [Coriobacteriales bacterium]|nr:hypothetical protein [Coriobacteriales bacterium]
RPSILLEEDGRGAGFAELLDAPSIQAWDYRWYGKAIRPIAPKAPPRIRRHMSVIEPCTTAVRQVDEALSDFVAGHDGPYEASVAKIEATYPVMKGFIESI